MSKQIKSILTFCSIALIKVAIAIFILPAIIIFQLPFDRFIGNRLYDITKPMGIYGAEEEILALNKLLAVSEFNTTLCFFYIILLFISIPMPKIIDILKKHKEKRLWANVSYQIIFVSVIVISAFIIFSNLQYYSKIIVTGCPLDVYIGYAFFHHILGICFCVLLWSKFYGDIILVCKIAVSRLRGNVR